MYQLIISPKAGKQLKQLKQVYENAISLAIDELKDDPFVGKLLTLDLTGKFSYKVGNYRIIYKINQQNKLVRIISAGHRSIIYN